MEAGGEKVAPPQLLSCTAGVTTTSVEASSHSSLPLHALTACTAPGNAGHTGQKVRGSILSIESILQDKREETSAMETDISSGAGVGCGSAPEKWSRVAGEWLKSPGDSGCDDSGICLNSSCADAESVSSYGSQEHGARSAELLPCDADPAVSTEAADLTCTDSAASDAADKKMVCSSGTLYPSPHVSAEVRGAATIAEDVVRTGGAGSRLCMKQTAPWAKKEASEVTDRISVVQEDDALRQRSKIPAEKGLGSCGKVSVKPDSPGFPVGVGPLGSSKKSGRGKGQLVDAISLRLKIKQFAKTGAAVTFKHGVEVQLGAKQEEKSAGLSDARLMRGGSEFVAEEKSSSESRGLKPAASSGSSSGLKSTGPGEGQHPVSDGRVASPSCCSRVLSEESSVSLGKSPTAALPPKASKIGREDSGRIQLKSAQVENSCTKEEDRVGKSWPPWSDTSSQDVPVESVPPCSNNRRTSRRRSAGVKRKSADFIELPSDPSWDEALDSSDVPFEAKSERKQRSSRRSSAGINRRSAAMWESEEKISEKKSKRRRRRRASKPNPSPTEVTESSVVDKYASRRGRRPANSSAINDASVVDPESGRRMFPCPQCNKLFTRVEGVKIHMRIHTGEKPYSCEICGKRFHESGGLRHHRNVHVGAKPHPCPYCKKRFTSNYGLHRHVRMHKGDDTYICSECGKTFGEASSLKVHRRIHSGDHPYRCQLCDKTFCQLGNYQSHMRIHTGERPYSCSVCGKSFRQSNVLQKHVRIHSGERPFVCQRCGKAFNDSGHLQRHWRTHTGERPYQCSLCGKRFAQGAQIHRCETPEGKLFHEAGNGPFVFVGSRANRNGVPLTSLHLSDSKSARPQSRQSQSPVQSVISSSSQLQQRKTKFDASIPDDALFISGTDVAELDAKTSAEILQNDIFSPSSKGSSFDDRLDSDVWDEETSYEDSYAGSTEDEEDENNNNDSLGDEDDEETVEDEEDVEEEEEEEDAENSEDPEEQVQGEGSKGTAVETSGQEDSIAGVD